MAAVLSAAICAVESEATVAVDRPVMASARMAAISRGAKVAISPLEKAAICARVREVVWPLISSGRIRLAGETRFPVEEVRAAPEWLASGENVGKIVLTF